MEAREIDLKEYLRRQQARVNQVLDELLPSASVLPGRLHEAMRYSVFAGGKRLRPVLVIASAEAANRSATLPNERAVLEAGAAMELLHTYSLVHDDLPAMDNDDLRRGKPTCHKAYDEATGVLVGDALQALAFQTLAGLSGACDEERIECLQAFSRAVGSQGMVGGQMEDLLSEGNHHPRGEEVVSIHQHKTAALLEACCLVGARLGGGTKEDIERLGEYGQKLGLAFQIIDDILDVVGEEQILGKSTGKDESSRKATFPAVFGLENAREKADTLIEEAKDKISEFKENAMPLRALADFVAARNH